MNARLSHIRDLLLVNKSARNLLEQRQRELALLRHTHSLLPESMRAHCLDAAVAGHQLTLYFDSPAWTTRARFLTEDIVTSLGKQQITDIRIQVRVNCDDIACPSQTQVSRRRLTVDTAKHLLEAADNLRDPELRDVLKRFASRHLLPPTEKG